MYRQDKAQISPLKRRGRRGLAFILCICLFVSLFALTVGAEKATCNIVSINDGTSNIGYTVRDGYLFADSTGLGKQYKLSVKREDLIFNTDMPNSFGVGDIVTVDITLAVPTNVTQGAISIGGVYYYIDTWQLYPDEGKGPFYYASFSVTRSFPEAVANQGIYLYIHSNGGIERIVVLSFSCSINNDPSIAIGSAADKINNNNNNNTNQIKANQDKNTDKVIQNQKDLQEKEKKDSEDGGNSSSKKAQDSIPQVDGGFLTAIKSLVNSMSYTGTEAKLPIPKAYIPALAGMEETVLIPEQEYDMSQAITDYVPLTLLTLIKHLFTIALVLFCVKELYGLIQYVLTLKGGGKE